MANQVEQELETVIQDDLTARQTKVLDSQEIICSFFYKIVKSNPADVVITEFVNLFILLNRQNNQELIEAIYQIINFNQEDIFLSTLKRSCYILINNWNSKRNHQSNNNIQKLLLSFEQLPATKSRLTPTKKRLQTWLNNFINSDDYRELRLFTSKSTPVKESNWTSRYASYFLVSQSLDNAKPEEQREAARATYQRLQEKFKFDLAMYTARSQSSHFVDESYHNPTVLGDKVLYLIQKVLARRGAFSHANLANIFLKQTEGMRYREFKCSLVKYLTNSLGKSPTALILSKKIAAYLNSLYEKHDQQIWNADLLLRTSNRLIELLTTQNRGEPSQLFTLLATQEQSLALVILLLKVILICKHSRSHLESCIAHLIKHYEQEPETQCQWFITFLETLEVSLTICLENVHYDVISLNSQHNNSTERNKFRDYWVFSQVKQVDSEQKVRV